MKQPINDQMLTVMKHPQTKEAKFNLSLELVDGSKRQGVFVDIVRDPLNRIEFKDTEFLVFLSNRPEPGMKTYLPLTQIATIEWSL